ncbi:hypothetical protein L484_004972 [Morus notabilis]|uniref:Uncharacterized protein n=1 Tax=Morus notabilis TaxID=981085 RepID=W9SV41_9ROSA|nr:hypothetical protein L484_004972 [Morus notabilis]
MHYVFLYSVVARHPEHLHGSTPRSVLIEIYRGFSHIYLMAGLIAMGLQALVDGLSCFDTRTTKNNQIIREK